LDAAAGNAKEVPMVRLGKSTGPAAMLGAGDGEKVSSIRFREAAVPLG